MSDKHLNPSTTSSEQAAKTQRTAPTKINPVGRRTFLVLVAICVASFIGHLVLLPHMPEMIPTHWDSAGNVNGYTGRVAIIGLDALPLLLLAMLRHLPGMDPRGQAYMRMGSFYNGFVVLFTLFMVGMTWTSELTVFGILPENGSPIGTITTLVVGMGFILLGNYMPKIKRNYTFGCKTPWALHDEWNWRLTHRFCGTAFVISGFATIAGGLISIWHGQASLWILLGSVLASSIGTYAYSYLVFRNGNKPLRSR